MYSNNDQYYYKAYEPSYSAFGNSAVTLSQQASRFWLPFDLKLLETLTPREYLENYCRVHHRRHVLYKRVFDKHRDIGAELNLELLFDALSETYMDTMDKRLITQVIHLLDLPDNAKITYPQFRGIAAFSERYFFNIFKRSNQTNSQFQKEILEILDFSSLKWKLADINISFTLQQILRFI